MPRPVTSAMVWFAPNAFRSAMVVVPRTTVARTTCPAVSLEYARTSASAPGFCWAIVDLRVAAVV